MEKIKFGAGSSSPFFNSLDREVKRILRNTQLLSYSKRLLWGKMIFYYVIHISTYILLFLIPHESFFPLMCSYLLVGISGIFLAFNVSHDACHETFSKIKWVNNLIYHLSFNLQGTNAYLWKIRHTASHHLFPNVDGCDADIDDNPFLRLSPQHRVRKYQRFQHVYAVIIYSIYTLHWLFFKDFLYLFKKRVANLRNKSYSSQTIFLFIFWKLAYLTVLIIIPIKIGYPPSHVLFAFIIMHVINSQFFIHILIVTHLCMETEFPKTDEKGFLPGDYYIHQLATSLDYHSESKLCNWLLGGFNAHAAHHLYPKMPHTVYPVLARIIERKAKEFHAPYHKSGLLPAIKSHYMYLKIMGKKV